jgi:hypothetical protein
MNFGQEMELSGVFQGRDLYVENPFSEEGVGFCVYEVKVNGELTSDEINSSAFAIDLALYQFTKGDPISIAIKHKNDCEPRVINPEAIRPQSTYTLESFTTVQSGKVTWSASNENGSLLYVLEQFKWNKWVEIATVVGDGRPDLTEYSVDVRFLNGPNTYRLRQKDFNGDNTSEEMSYESDVPEVTIANTKVAKNLEFSEETHFELYSEFGELKSTGIGTSVDISSYDSGTYYVNYGKHFGSVITLK